MSGAGQLSQVAVENHVVAVDPEEHVRQQREDGAQVAVCLQQFLRAQVERALEHFTVRIRLLVGVAHHVEQGAPLRGDGPFALEMENLAQQQAVPLPVAHASLRVVMVMVWLWRSQRAPGVSGEISP